MSENPAPRAIAAAYADPLSAVWLEAAARLGLTIVRGDMAYASLGPGGVLNLAHTKDLDPDDCLAQMIFHEICHWLVQGREAIHNRDWGLPDAVTTGDQTATPAPAFANEHACLRLQATLADRHGLREVLAPTTDFRAFYDALPALPLFPRQEASVVLAIGGLHLAGTEPFASVLDQALTATHSICQAAAAATSGQNNGLPWIFGRTEPLRTHPTGLPIGSRPAASTDTGALLTCNNCAWKTHKQKTDHCVRAKKRTSQDAPACQCFEPALDCQSCGACCSTAYHTVDIQASDPFVAQNKHLLVRVGRRWQLPRPGGDCVALLRTNNGTRMTCTVYADRPVTCRDFAQGGPHCLTARERTHKSM